MHEQSLRVLNDSGFPLQVALHRAVNEATGDHGWQVRYEEHAWRGADANRTGFIDLVLVDRRSAVYVTVECKRVRDSEWVFLRSDGEATQRRHAQVWLSQFWQGQFRAYGWSQLQVEPICPEVQFCAIRGQSSSDKSNLIERTSAELVMATEAIAHEHQDLRRREDLDMKVFLSVLVTTAVLKVARFDPSRVSLLDGTLDSAEFQEVPFVRFRKQLGAVNVADLSRDVRATTDLAYLKESTVFVVQAKHLNDFLRELEVSGAALGGL